MQDECSGSGSPVRHFDSDFVVLVYTLKSATGNAENHPTIVLSKRLTAWLCVNQDAVLIPLG